MNDRYELPATFYAPHVTTQTSSLLHAARHQLGRYFQGFPCTGPWVAEQANSYSSDDKHTMLLAGRAPTVSLGHTSTSVHRLLRQRTGSLSIVLFLEHSDFTCDF